MRLILLTIVALIISIEAAPAVERARVWKPKAEREQLKVEVSKDVPVEVMAAEPSNLESPRSHIRRTKVAAVNKETVEEVPTDVASNTLTTEASIIKAVATEEPTTQTGSRIRTVSRGELQKTKTPGRRISSVRGSQTVEPAVIDNTVTTTSRPRRIETTTASETATQGATRKISRGRQTTTTTTTTTAAPETTTTPEPTTTTEQVAVEPSTESQSVETVAEQEAEVITATTEPAVIEAEVEVTTTATAAEQADAQPEVTPTATEQQSAEQVEEVTTTTTTTTTTEQPTTTTEQPVSTTVAAKVSRVVAKGEKGRKPVVRVEKKRPSSSSQQQTVVDTPTRVPAQQFDEEVVAAPAFNPVKL